MTRDPLLLRPERALFEALSRVCDGHSAQEVTFASLNLVVNAIRQAHPRREAALRALDEVFARTKGLLAEHYDFAGRKKGIFPYDQVVVMPLTEEDDRW